MGELRQVFGRNKVRKICAAGKIKELRKRSKESYELINNLMHKPRRRPRFFMFSIYFEYATLPPTAP